MGTEIFNYLKKLGLTSLETKKLYSSKTRDVDNLKVWRDEKSGVIFIDEYFTGQDTYISGLYRDEKVVQLKTGKPNFERKKDAERRFNSHLKYVADKNIVDFGCGSGEFLNLVKPFCNEIIGIELQKDYVNFLNSKNIKCISNISGIENNSIDTVVSFHVIEHLPDPIKILSELGVKLKSGGTIIIEVPHANDFLLTYLKNENFKNFTLWSQHLVLHTRESLNLTLIEAGYQNIQIYGTQRYPLSNHLNWLKNGKPGGHKSILSEIDTENLSDAYEKALCKINATDTLVAIANVS